jgi:1-acyl-sn-glycerol-3-phosphate acyltransferase
LIWILKIFIRLALWLFCIDISIKNKRFLKTKGPLLIIANHPNSFLDAIIIGAQYQRPIHFLARGDAFSKKHHRFLLGLLNMIPVYRLREGKQYLHLNEYAFKESVRLLKKGEAVLIFIEGTCINSHELQPFKKGATRIIESIHKEGVNPTIHITGIAYNQLKGIGKYINISINELILNNNIKDAKDRVLFNKEAFLILNENIIQPSSQTNINKSLFYYFHLPYYNLIKNFAQKKTKGTVFFDSVLSSLLLFTYPLFLLLVFLILHLLLIPDPIIFGILLCIPIVSKQQVYN